MSKALAFGKHSLQTFSHPLFKKLALEKPPLEKRTHWQVKQGGKTIPVVKNDFGQVLVHVMRDPLRKGGLLVLRKSAAERTKRSSSHYFWLYTVGPKGFNQHVGRVYLRLYPDLARFENLDIEEHVFQEKPQPKGEQRKFVTYNYRKKRLGPLLMMLCEEIARLHGYKEIEADFDPETTGKFAPKHGWKKIKDSNFGFVKSLR